MIDRWFIKSHAENILKVLALFQTLFKDDFPDASVQQTIWQSHVTSVSNLVTWILRTVLQMRSLVFTVQSLTKPTVVKDDSQGSKREQQSGRIPLCHHMPFRTVPSFLQFTWLFFHETEWRRLGHFPLNSQSHLRGKHFM